MKSFMIRAFVIALALTGAAATAHSNTIGHAVSANASAYPVPMCLPGGGQTCGLD